ncbi:MAG: molybdenum cofactor guanylyltransferase [Armatimonadetes bacterium]|nr:MAG: molybdenum cofactor guanylyltransferase [Armatimonadota bacterium]
MRDVEGVLLAGGASRRMGRDKALIEVDGVPLVRLLAQRLREVCARVTILGRHQIEGCEFLPDRDDFKGPLQALARFEPRQPYVFLLACDIPLFDARLVPYFRQRIGEEQAAVVPLRSGKWQPLCALYRDFAFGELRLLNSLGENRLMPWLDLLDIQTVESAELVAAGFDPKCIASADTPDELRKLVRGYQAER